MSIFIDYMLRVRPTARQIGNKPGIQVTLMNQLFEVMDNPIEGVVTFTVDSTIGFNTDLVAENTIRAAKSDVPVLKHQDTSSNDRSWLTLAFSYGSETRLWDSLAQAQAEIDETVQARRERKFAECVNEILQILAICYRDAVKDKL